MKKYITTEEAIEHCKEENTLIPSEFLSIFPNNFGINLCAVKGFEVDMTDDNQYKSIRIDFIPAEKSEDERIRESLIEYIKGITSWNYFLGISKEQMIAWLEKHSEKSIHEDINETVLQYEDTCPVDGEITHDNVTEPYWNNHSMMNTYKAGWLEKQGKELNIPQDPEDALRRQSTIQVLEYARSLDAYNQYGKESINKDIAWLKRQDNQKSIRPVWKYKKDNTPLLRDSFICNKYGCVAQSPSGALVSDVWVLDFDELAKLPKEEFEELGEQKSTGKVDPKYKVGDWITDGISTFQIANIEDECYITDDENMVPFCAVHPYYHPWSLQDAKDGDVLSFSDKTIVLFKDLYNATTFHSYFHIEDDIFGISKDEMPDWWNGEGFHPATEEQCDLLFSRMKEAGYEWDDEKKELKKIEQKPTDKVEAEYKVGDWIISNDKSVHEDYRVCRIEKIEDDRYYIDSGGFLTKSTLEEFNYHLWSIQDAKDGDVLSNGKMIVIFKHFEEPSYRQHIVAYIGLDNSCDIQITDDTWNLGIDKTKPATKEQRDLLFQKMKEAGYEWDDEKKELKEIESRSAWSEEDERMMFNVLECLKNGWKKLPTDILKYESWLKSLKERVKGE